MGLTADEFIRKAQGEQPAQQPIYQEPDTTYPSLTADQFLSAAEAKKKKLAELEAAGAIPGMPTAEQLEPDVLGEFARTSLRDIKSVPGSIAAGAGRGLGGMIKTAGGLVDRAVDLVQPQQMILRELAKQRGVDLVGPGEFVGQKLASIPEGAAQLIEEKTVSPEMNPYARALTAGIGELGGSLPGISAVMKGVQAVKWIPQAVKTAVGLGVHGALEGISEEDIKKAAEGGAAGGALGVIGGLAGKIRPKYLKILAEGLGFGSVTAAEKAIREGEVPDIDKVLSDPDIFASTGLGVILGAGGLKGKERGKVDIAAQEAKIKKELLKRVEAPEKIPGEPKLTEAEIRGKAEAGLEGMLTAKEPVPIPEPPTPPAPKLPAEGLPSVPERKVSKYRLNTMEKIVPPEQLKKMPVEDYEYAVQKNRDTMAAGVEKASKDPYGAMNYLLNKKKIELDGYDGALELAVSNELIRKGDYSTYRKFTKEFYKRHKAAGQFNQALSMADKFSPERILNTTEGIIEKAGKEKGVGKLIERQIKKKGDIIDDAFAKDLIKEAQRIEMMPEGYLKDRATARILKMIEDKIPKSIGQKLSTIQVIHQLLNAKTALRNIIGNAGFAVVDIMTQAGPGVGVDKLLSKLTGKRSLARMTGGQLKKYMDGFAEGVRKGTTETWEGIDTTGLELKRMLGPEGEGILRDLTGTSSGNVLSQYDIKGGTFKKGMYSFLEKMTGMAMRVPDRAAFNASFKESLDNMMRAQKVKNPTKDMLAIAIQEGLARTYQDVNFLSKRFTEFKKWLNFGKAFGLGDIILKYPKTPANLLARGIDYSPFGLMNGMRHMLGVMRDKKATPLAAQRKAAIGTARGLTGTGIYALGALMYGLGLVTPATEEEEKVAELKEATGERRFSVNADALARFLFSGMNPDVAKKKTGDLYLSYDWFQPLSNSFAMGVDVAKTISEKKKATPMGMIEPLILSVEAGISSLAEQPLVSGIARFMGAPYSKPSDRIVEGLKRSLQSMPTSFIPTLIGQFRYTVDPNFRNIYKEGNTEMDTAWNLIKNKLPWLSSSLERRVDVLGEKKAIEASPFGKLFDILNIFVSPAISKKYTGDAGTEFVLGLYDETGETKHLPRKLRGKKYTTEQKIQYQEMFGERYKQLIERLMGDYQFKRRDPEKQVEQIFRAINQIGYALRGKLRRKL